MQNTKNLRVAEHAERLALARGAAGADEGDMVRLRRAHSGSKDTDAARPPMEPTTWLLSERSPDGGSAPFVARIAAVGRRLPPRPASSLRRDRARLWDFPPSASSGGLVAPVA